MRAAKRIWLICSFAILTAAFNPPGAAADDRALLIGVNAYKHLPPRLQLTAAENDARLMHRVAQQVWRFAPQNIQMLLNQDATARAIRTAIREWLIDGTQPGDRVLLYYSGHGAYVPDRNSDEADGRDEALAPHDVVMDAATMSFSNVLTDDELGELLDELVGRDVMVVIDSCYSGTITRALTPAWRSLRPQPTGQRWRVRSLLAPQPGGDVRGPTRASPSRFTRLRGGPSFLDAGPGKQVWTAVAPTELAEETVGGFGAFTKAFAAGLLQRQADLNKNGRIVPAELLQHVRRQTNSYCAERRHFFPCVTGMTPTLLPEEQLTAPDLLAWSGRSQTPANAPEQQATTDLLPARSHDGLTVELIGGGRVGGAPLKIRVTSPQDGYLIVIDRRADGSAVQLFPSDCVRPSRHIRAGAPLTLPDPSYGCRFVPQTPGRGEIIAIVTQDNVRLEDLLGRHRDLTVVPNGEAYLAQIAAELMQVWTDDSRNRPVKWGMAVADYVVER